MPNLNIHLKEESYQKLLQEKKELERKINAKITWDRFLEIKLISKDETELKREIFLQTAEDIKRFVEVKIDPTIVETLKELHYYIIFKDNKNAISEAEKLIKLLQT